MKSIINSEIADELMNAAGQLAHFKSESDTTRTHLHTYYKSLSTQQRAFFCEKLGVSDSYVRKLCHLHSDLPVAMAISIELLSLARVRFRDMCPETAKALHHIGYIHRNDVSTSASSTPKTPLTGEKLQAFMDTWSD